VTPTRLLAACSAVLVTLGAASADNWPQWRGPTNDGICKETNLPTEWSDTTNVVWKLKMPGKGSSTPVIWGDRMFLTSADGNDLVLMCVSTEGKELWKKTLGTGDKRFLGGEGNNASASACTDGKHVWAIVGTGDCGCFDFDGKEVWKFNAQERYGKFNIMHGMHTTPVLHGDRLYLALLHEGGQWVLALEKATGKDVWKVERPTDGVFEGRHGYASPVLWSNGKDEYLLVHGCDYATAHKLSDGSEIWRLGDLNPKSEYRRDLRMVATPAISPDLIVVPTAKDKGVVAVKPDAKGTIAKGNTSEAWRLSRGTTDVPSPVIHDGLVYMCREDGQKGLVCLDAKNGKEVYQERLHSGLYRASPVLADGKLYLTCRDGTFTVVKLGQKFEKVAENTLKDMFTASPAVSGGRIYLRGWDALYCIGTPAK
jgi:outer membrane protein assembly factor BamB